MRRIILNLFSLMCISSVIGVAVFLETPLAADTITDCDRLVFIQKDGIEVLKALQDIDSKKVIKECAKAISEFPNNPKYYLCLSVGYFKEHRYVEAYETAKTAIQKGDARAHFFLATLFSEGLGVEKNDSLARSHLKKAAESEIPWGAFNYAVYCRDGIGGNKDIIEAYKWFKKASDLGVSQAKIHLEELLWSGDEILDQRKAVQLWEEVADKEPIAKYKLGLLYRYGLGGKIVSFPKAAAYFLDAAKAGIVDSMFQFALLVVEGKGVKKDPKLAALWIERAAESGHGNAQLLWAMYLHEGYGTKVDNILAFSWLQEAAKKDLPVAQAYLAHFYKEGIGTEVNYKAAVNWYEKAISNGNKVAIWELAKIKKGKGENIDDLLLELRKLAKSHNKGALLQLHGFGHLYGIDEDEQLYWLRYDAENGDSYAQAALGNKYAYGDGVINNQKKAFNLFKKSAEQGDRFGLYSLGSAYDYGIGVEIDLEKAVAAYTIAADKGEITAAKRLGIILMNGGIGVQIDFIGSRKYFEMVYYDHYKNINNLNEESLEEYHEVANFLGLICNLLGDYSSAEDYIYTVLNQSRNDKERDLALIALLPSIISMIESKGHPEKANDLFTAALAATNKNDTIKRITILNQYSNYLLSQNQYKEALVQIESTKGDIESLDGNFKELYIMLYEVYKSNILGQMDNHEDAYKILKKTIKKISKTKAEKTFLGLWAMGMYANILGELGYLDESIRYYTEVHSLLEGSALSEHPIVVEHIINFAKVLEKNGEHKKAFSQLEKAKTHYIQWADSKRNRRFLNEEKEQKGLRKAWINYIDILYKTFEENNEYDKYILTQVFEVMQIGSSTNLAKSITLVSARYSFNDSALEGLVRKRYEANEKLIQITDYLFENQFTNSLRTEFPEKHHIDTLRIAKNEISAIDIQLKEKYPKFYDLTSMKPISLMETKHLLHSDEALIIFLFGEYHGYVFIITKEDEGFFHIDDLGSEELKNTVKNIRSGVDPGQATSVLGLPTLNLNESNKFYNKLFVSIEKWLNKKKNILIIPDGALSSLPFYVLPIGSPLNEISSLSDYRNINWFAKRNAITIIHSIGVLRGLRSDNSKSKANKIFAGFGDPSLDGTIIGNMRGAWRRGKPIKSTISAEGNVNLDELRMLSPLPDTAYELQQIAKLFNSLDSVYLRDDATEAKVKGLNLEEYKIVAFATHGLVAGELSGLSEPALVLTPPITATETDDGLLTAGEVATLKFDADWIILSACNTAAGDGRPGADELSGLARAFFLAGSRALLVSNWPVLSEAAVELTSNIFKLMKGNPKIGRSEALRLSMLHLLFDDNLPEYMMHPAAWAPFIVVGEGGVLNY